MKNVKLILVVLVLVLPYIFIFRNFFLPGTLAWGDAPYYYSQNLQELFSEPFLWNYRNDNFGSDQSQLLWLYFPTFLAGFINHFLELNFEILVRLLFYIPATLLSLWGSFKFIGFFSKNFSLKILASFLFTFNTYFLLLIDGGQIGVALAYGLFPATIYAFLNFFGNANLISFMKAFLFFFLLTNTDLRVAVIALLFIVLLVINKFYESLKFNLLRKQFSLFFLVFFIVIFLDLFWILPFLNGGGNSLKPVPNQNGNFVSLLHSFYLFQPHFPLNEFGKTFTTSIYFGFLPLVLISWVILGKTKSRIELRPKLMITLFFLIFAFLAKGSNEPFPQIYDFLTDKVPFGYAFRDPTKFYIPLLLTSAILFVISAGALKKVTGKKLAKFILVMIFIYLNILIFPAYTNGMSGVLGKPIKLENFNQSTHLLQEQPGFFRSLWFPERPPLSYSDWDKPALSANTLSNDRPFGSMTQGDYDRYGFLHNGLLSQWLDLLGVKYVFFPENERKKVWTEKEKNEKRKFLEFINQIPGLEKIDLIKEFPGYKTEQSKPHIFAQRSIFAVVGGDEIYQKLNKSGKFYLPAQGFLFLEDGFSDPNILNSVSRESAILVLENKGRVDLALSFLKNKMLAPFSAFTRQWAIRQSNQYLTWKAELLEKGIKTLEYDFGKGVAFSTVKNEQLTFEVEVPKRGEYYFATRFSTASDSSGIKVNFNGQNKLINGSPSQFKWDLMGPFYLDKNKYQVIFINNGGLSALNTFLLTEKNEFLEALKRADSFIGRFETIKIESDEDYRRLEDKLADQIIPVEYHEINPTRYVLTIPQGAKWLVFTDRFNNSWRLSGSFPVISLPFYSMINGFQIDKNHIGKQVEINYLPQRKVGQGIILSIGSGIVIFLVAGLIFIKRKHES